MRVSTATPTAGPRERLEALLRKYDDLWSKHRALLRQAHRSASERSGVAALGLFALKVSDAAYAVADAENIRFRSGRWHDLERDRTAWRATARNPAAPASAATLVHLAVAAAERLTRRSAPEACVARYERPERGDVFDVRFERTGNKGEIGIAIRDVTRLVLAERELAVLKRTLEEAGRETRPNEAAPGAGRGRHVGREGVPRQG